MPHPNYTPSCATETRDCSAFPCPGTPANLSPARAQMNWTATSLAPGQTIYSLTTRKCPLHPSFFSRLEKAGYLLKIPFRTNDACIKLPGNAISSKSIVSRWLFDPSQIPQVQPATTWRTTTIIPSHPSHVHHKGFPSPIGNLQSSTPPHCAPQAQTARILSGSGWYGRTFWTNYSPLRTWIICGRRFWSSRLRGKQTPMAERKGAKRKTDIWGGCKMISGWEGGYAYNR